MLLPFIVQPGLDKAQSKKDNNIKEISFWGKALMSYLSMVRRLTDLRFPKLRKLRKKRKKSRPCAASSAET